MSILDLISSQSSERLSHTKLWTNIAYAVASAVVILQNERGTLTTELLLIYLAVVGAHGAASKWISARYGIETKEPHDD